MLLIREGYTHSKKVHVYCEVFNPDLQAHNTAICFNKLNGYLASPRWKNPSTVDCDDIQESMNFILKVTSKRLKKMNKRKEN